MKKILILFIISFMSQLVKGQNITLDQLAPISANTLVGNSTGGSAVPTALSASAAKTLLSLNNVENTALSTWTGSTNITTLGTIGTGAWNATAIADGKIASALTGKTYNGLTLTANATGFSIAGGTTSKTLTLSNTLTLAGTDGSTLNIGAGGTLGSAAFTSSSAYEVPLTFSTGLTRSTNTITVNTSQNITTLSNLTSNGYVKTSGGAGTLGVSSTVSTSDLSGTVSIANGGTNLSSLGTALQQLRVNAGGTALEYFTPSAGSGDITNGGNTTGAGIIIGTNDAFPLSFETNGVTKYSISSAGLHTYSLVGVNNAVTEIIRIDNIPSGNGGVNYGSRINFRLKDDVGATYDAGQIDTYWSALDGSGGLNRATIKLKGHRNGGIQDFATFDGLSLIIGSSGTATYGPSSITTSGSFVLGNSGNQIQIGATSQDLKINPSATSSALAQFTSTNKGILFPSNTASGIASVSSPAANLIMYQTDGRVGLKHYVNSSWVSIDKGVVIAPSALVGDNSNYTPSNFAESSVVKISNASSLYSIRGLAYSGPSTPNAEDRKTLVNNGSYPLWFPMENPSATAAYRFSGPNDYILMPGYSVDVRYDGTLNRWKFVTNQELSSLAGIGHNQYYSYNASSITSGELSEIEVSAGTGTITTVAPANSMPLGLGIGTSTSTTGASSMYFAKGATGGDFFTFGAAHIIYTATVSFPTLSDGTNTYEFQIGLLEDPTDQTVNPNNHIGIRYKSGVNSGKFQGFSRNSGGSETTVDLGVTVAANTLYTLTIAIDKSIAEARFYVNGTYANRTALTMPSAVNGGARAVIVKSAGSTERKALIHNAQVLAVYP